MKYIVVFEYDLLDEPTGEQIQDRMQALLDLRERIQPGLRPVCVYGAIHDTADAVMAHFAGA